MAGQPQGLSPALQRQQVQSRVLLSLSWRCAAGGESREGEAEMRQ